MTTFQFAGVQRVCPSSWYGQRLDGTKPSPPCVVCKKSRTVLPSIKLLRTFWRGKCRSSSLVLVRLPFFEGVDRVVQAVKKSIFLSGVLFFPGWRFSSRAPVFPKSEQFHSLISYPPSPLVASSVVPRSNRFFLLQQPPVFSRLERTSFSFVFRNDRLR